MTSKKVGSSLSSLFQQWSNHVNGQSQHDDDVDPGIAQDTTTTTRIEYPSYRMLFQMNYSMSLRCQAAAVESIETAQVYRRAGLPTPKETATQDILATTAWLEYLATLAEETTAAAAADCHVLWIQTRSTTTTTTTTTAAQYNQQQQRRRHIIDLSKDPWGWDSDDNEDDKEDNNNNQSSPPSLQDLSELYDYIQQIILQTGQSTSTTTAASPVVVIWDSLESLIQMHGLHRTLHCCLCKFTNSFQIWPIRMDGLTNTQHAILENQCQALLQLQSTNGFFVTMIRQGIREPGNIVRQQIPFELQNQQQNGGQNVMVVVELAQNNTETEESTTTTTTTTTAGTKSVNSNDTNTTVPSLMTEGTVTSSSRPKIQLKLEDGERTTNSQETTTSSSTSAAAATDATNRPRIFVQDDDPEFEDLDEEDPDDDLDI